MNPFITVRWKEERICLLTEIKVPLALTRVLINISGPEAVNRTASHAEDGHRRPEHPPKVLQRRDLELFVAEPFLVGRRVADRLHLRFRDEGRHEELGGREEQSRHAHSAQSEAFNAHFPPPATAQEGHREEEEELADVAEDADHPHVHRRELEAAFDGGEGAADHPVEEHGLWREPERGTFP